MAREAKGYALKRRLGRVPFRYGDRRGVFPPVSECETARYMGDTIDRARQAHQWRTPLQRLSIRGWSQHVAARFMFLPPRTPMRG